MDVCELKFRHLGVEFARDREVKGKELFKGYAFKLAQQGIVSRNLSLGADLIDYIVAKRLPVFGCVCFEKRFLRFHAADVTALDKSFRYLFERVDAYMKRELPEELACLVFDDRNYNINLRHAEAITNFFQRDARGMSMDSIVRTPLFAISQAHNVGLQLADVVTTVISLRFASNKQIAPYYSRLRKAVPDCASDRGPFPMSGLKVMRDPGGENRKRRAAFRPMVGTRKPFTRRWAQ